MIIISSISKPTYKMNQRLHKNARTTLAVRQEIRQSDESTSRLAERYNLSWKTVKKWRIRDTADDKTSRPDKLNVTLLKEQEDLILFERRQFKKTVEEIFLTLRDKLPDIYPMKVYRCLKRYGLNVLPDELTQAEKKIKKFRKYTIGYLHMDVLYAPKINKERRYVFTCIDRASKVAYVEVRERKTKNDGKQFLQNALDFYPYKINYILTDNGQEFCYKALPKSKATKKIHPFVALCKQHKIQHRTIKFKHPWTNGMVERFNGKIKSKVFKRYLFESIADLGLRVVEYVNNYNFNIALCGLQFKTPADHLKDKFDCQIKEIDI